MLSTRAGETSTQAEVQSLRQRLPLHKFPALAPISDDELAAMAQTAKSSGKELDALDIFRKTVLKPKRGGPPATKRMHEEGKARRDMNASRTHMRHAGRPPFSPANPYAAKEAVARKMDERFVSQGTPYDTAHDQYVADMTADMRKTVGPFRPAAPSQAREAIKLDVYLHSADESTKLAEKMVVREKAAQNMRDYATMQQERRGQTLVNTKSQPFPFPEQMRYRR